MRGLFAVAAALLAITPAAHADVTIGSELPAPGIPKACGGGCTVSTTSIPGRATIAPSGGGIITRWQIRAGLEVVPVQLVVMSRPAGPTGAGRVVRSSVPVTPTPNTVTIYEADLPIAAGEYIGIDCCPTGTVGSYFAQTPGVTTSLWSPSIANGVTEQPTVDDGTEVLVQADIEPDRDGDGNGDDTQDNDDDGDGVPDATDDCPTKPAPTANGCAAPAAAARVNTPPVVRFRTPTSGTAVKAVQTIELDVADDAGSPTVTVFDDDGTICARSGPPYSCTWRPTGADVGRATLLASAVDSDNRSTLGIVRVKVARFEADLTRRVRGRRVTGRLVLPAAVEKALGCRGEVTVRRGRAIRAVALKRNCTYSARLPRGRGRIRARFAGNPVVEPAT
jgi:Bacterial Ig domain